MTEPSAHTGAVPRTLVVLNPHAGGGRGIQLWRRERHAVEALLGSYRLHKTSNPSAAEHIIRQALRLGTHTVVCVGGDGSMHAAVNGFFERQTPVNPDATLVPLFAGTGCDFARALRRLAPEGGASGQIDMGQVTCMDAAGAPVYRYFVNMASVGLSADVLDRMALPSFPRMPSGTLAFLIAILQVLWRSACPLLHVSVDGRSLPPHRTHCVAIGNGHSFAGGLRITPHARLNDGRLDVTSVGDASPLWLLRYAYRFYRGTHLALPGIHHTQGRRITLRSPEPVRIEADGELLGWLPATITVQPAALRVQRLAGRLDTTAGIA
ncbi:MAG: hypothetical protein GVY12_15285 [Bacteroidetes bacterium]|jgi:diacylglycerol kinase family enzyme|nr:hypothetical protein [Bacteroidota bacterium]